MTEKHWVYGFKTAALFCVMILGFITTIGTSGDSGSSTDSSTTTDDTTTTVTANISYPNDGGAFIEGDTISFISKITNADGAYTYVWSSSKDGDLGTAANVTSNSLSPGSHTITLAAVDTDGNTVDSDTVSITVGESDSANNAPTADISAPSTDVSFNIGETITFQGSGTDYKANPILASNLRWSVDSEEGVSILGTGTEVSIDTLSQGEHIITLTATDNQGRSGAAHLLITVGASYSAPVVTITSPIDGDSILAGGTLSLIGTATEFDDDRTPITDDNLVWISSKDGIIGTGGSLEIDTRSVPALNFLPLKEGEHTLYLKAAGSTETGQIAVKFTLVNTAPTVTISNPPEECLNDPLCKTFAPGEWLNLQGTAIDGEDGDLSGESLEWKSHIDGFLGTGEILDIKTDSVPGLGGAAMSNGEHIITLEGRDEWGASGTTSVIITIGNNTSPVPVITDPEEDYTSDTAVGYITFYGNAEDAEDGVLTCDSLEWYRSDKQVKITPEEIPGSGVLTSSVRLDLSTFAAGTYTITLVATDSLGEKNVATRQLTVPE